MPAETFMQSTTAPIAGADRRVTRDLQQASRRRLIAAMPDQREGIAVHILNHDRSPHPGAGAQRDRASGPEDPGIVMGRQQQIAANPVWIECRRRFAKSHLAATGDRVVDHGTVDRQLGAATTGAREVDQLALGVRRQRDIGASNDRAGQHLGDRIGEHIDALVVEPDACRRTRLLRAAQTRQGRARTLAGRGNTRQLELA